MKWINLKEWSFNVAWRHYMNLLHYTFGTSKITDDMKQGFNHNYSIKYPHNYKILEPKLKEFYEKS